MRPTATRICRADLATVLEGMYVIAGESCTLQQRSEYGKIYEGEHVKVAHVKSGNTDISGLDQAMRRKLNVRIRDDGNLTMEAWCRADQLEIVDDDLARSPSRGGKYVCETCSKDLGTVVVSSKAVCPRCTTLCEVVGDSAEPQQDAMLKRLNQVIRLDRTITARMRVDVERLNEARRESSNS